MTSLERLLVPYTPHSILCGWDILCMENKANELAGCPGWHGKKAGIGETEVIIGTKRPCIHLEIGQNLRPPPSVEGEFRLSLFSFLRQRDLSRCISLWWCSQSLGFSVVSDGKESVCSARELGSVTGSGQSPWRKQWQPTPVFLPGESHGQRSLVDYSPWGRKRVGHDWATNTLTSTS